eukprot:scaffold72574_cov67-Phaeocystis_antarctica.AAC.4
MRLCFFTTLARGGGVQLRFCRGALGARATSRGAPRRPPPPRRARSCHIDIHAVGHTFQSGKGASGVCPPHPNARTCGMARAKRSPTLPHPAPERPHHSRRHPPNALRLSVAGLPPRSCPADSKRNPGGVIES